MSTRFWPNSGSCRSASRPRAGRSNGQLLPINQNQALFSLLGTTFGGDGRVNFALPDPGPRADGLGRGFTLGERGGEYNHTLIQGEMAQHIHFMMGKAATADTATPANTTSVAQAGRPSKIRRP